MSFRISAKNLFLTYPQCPLSPEIATGLLRDLFSRQDPVYVLVSSETHEDDTLHLHALVCLSKRKESTSANFADLTVQSGVTYHGNYQTARNIQHVKKYVLKNPVDTFVFGAEEDVFGPGAPSKEKVNARLARKIVSGKPLVSLISKPKYQPYLLTNLSKVKYFQITVATLFSKAPLPFPKIHTDLSPLACSVLRWMGLNLFEDSRPLRTKNLYLYSPPGCGKTTLCHILSRSLKTYFPSTGEKYFDGLENDHDLIVFDEFCGGQPLSLMNQILDGQECILPQRYQCLRKTKNIPVIILSNVSPFECYKKAQRVRVDAFVDRLKVLYFEEFLSIFYN